MPISIAIGCVWGEICVRPPGVPWNQKTTRPCGSPYSAKLIRRCVATRNVPSRRGSTTESMPTRCHAPAGAGNGVIGMVARRAQAAHAGDREDRHGRIASAAVDLDLPTGRTGVLPCQYLERAIAARVIDAGRFTIPEENVQPASLDLRLGEVAYRIRCSFLPDRQTVERRVKDLIIDELDLRKDGVVLETKRPYLIPLKERLALPAGIRGKANPKSSTGRIDVFTRVITDESYRFDEIADGYEGPMFLEVVPLSFPVRVREDLSLNQLRLSVGRGDLTDDDVRAFHREHSLVFDRDRPVPASKLALSNGLFLGLDLRGDATGKVGYRARDNAPLLDVTKSSAAPVDPEPFWETVRREDGDRVVLTPQR